MEQFSCFFCSRPGHQLKSFGSQCQKNNNQDRSQTPFFCHGNSSSKVSFCGGKQIKRFNNKFLEQKRFQPFFSIAFLGLFPKRN
jgi:hypothetical protein